MILLLAILACNTPEPSGTDTAMPGDGGEALDTADWPVDVQDDCNWLHGNWVGDGFYIAYNDDEYVEAEVEWWFGTTGFSTWYSTGSERTGEYTCDWQAQLLNLDLAYDTSFSFADIDEFTWRNLSDAETWGVLTRR